ncbi:MAG: isoprenylcysteine carboxylmethyltransferase family protein [Calditrichaceae bacterium]
MLFFLMWQWRPITNVIWYASNPFIRILLWIINATGWTLTIVSTRLINSDHFFGLKQTKQYARNQPVTDPPFQTPGAYRITRHPMMLGFLIAFWITPDMTAGHLYFSSLMTIYIFIGLRLEEKGLVNIFGKRYQEYRKRVSMLIPGIPSKVNARKWQTDK